MHFHNYSWPVQTRRQLADTKLLCHEGLTSKVRIGGVVQLTDCKGGPRPIDGPPRRPPVLKATPAPQTKYWSSGMAATPRRSSACGSANRASAGGRV